MINNFTFKKIVKAFYEANFAISLWDVEECPICGGVVNDKVYDICNEDDLSYVLGWNWPEEQDKNFALEISEVAEGWIELTLSTVADDVCTSCYEYELNSVHAYEYAEHYEDSEWAGSVFHHGVQAYNQASDPEVSIGRIAEIHDCYDMEICCSTEMIGPYGISVSGDIQVASKRDLWSVIDPDDGSRMFDEDSLDLIEHPDELYDIHGDHNEIIMNNTTIESIWCKDWVDDATKDALKKIANELDVFYLETSKRR